MRVWVVHRGRVCGFYSNQIVTVLASDGQDQVRLKQQSFGFVTSCFVKHTPLVKVMARAAFWLRTWASRSHVCLQLQPVELRPADTVKRSHILAFVGVGVCTHTCTNTDQ